ncbi:MAG: D-alanyl-D-alanine carboxypeptidase/D-alanyl-D-alanine-endopeptidase [Gallionella sp.]
MKLFALAMLAMLCLIQQAVGVTLPETVRDELRRAKIPLSSVGIVVQKMDADTPLLSQNAEQAMNPASTMKLLTTYAALEMLGPAYRWKTEAYLDGKLENGVLQGDLIFKGYGDPKLTVEQFWIWLRELRQRGLREIRGDVVLDRSFFELIDHDPSEFDNEPTRAYNVGPNALLLNFNALHLRLIPEATHTNALLVPDLSGYLINNRVTTTQRPCTGGDTYQARLEERSIVLEGTLPLDCGEVDDYFTLLPHGDYFFAVFSALWKEMGGTLLGGVREGSAPADQPAFSTHLSPPLSEVIRDINKFSNNTMARQLFLTLSAAVPARAPYESDNPVQEFMSLADLMDMLNAEGVALAETLHARPAVDYWASDGPLTVPARGTPKAGNLLSSIVDAELTTQQSTLPQRGNPPAASIPQSTEALQQWLSSEQMKFPELVLENGAGLSRKERISAQHLADLLRYAAQSRYAAELEASLPILGMDGTMKKRFSNERIAGYAHIKTGMLTGVKSIAGYVKADSGKQWVLVFIINHANASLAQPAQDALIEWLQKEY